MEIAKGTVWSGHEDETHFWNILEVNGTQYHIDLTWQQFPNGSYVKEFKILDRNNLGDDLETIKRCRLLKQRVEKYMTKIQ